jgi:hypothetical protein
MSQAGVMPYQQQHAENPWMWLLRKAADFCLSPLKGIPVVGGLFKFLEDTKPQQAPSTATRQEGYDNSAESQENVSGIDRLSSRQTNQDQSDVYAASPTEETPSYTTDEGDAVTFTDAFPAPSTEDLAVLKASTSSEKQ